LPQVVLGAFNPRNDVGMVMQYLHLGAATRTSAAIVALTVMPLIAAWLARQVLRLASPDQLANGRALARFMFSAATLPALIAIPLIIAFRVPRNVIEVVVVPVVVTVVGVTWIQAGASWLRAEPAGTGALRPSIAVPLAAVLILLLMFHLVLKPGIPFF
jgi:hypothetical protein